MSILDIEGADAALLFTQGAAKLYSEAIFAHPRRGRRVPHPEVDAANRVLTKARHARKRMNTATHVKVYIPPGRQIDQIELLLQRLREDDAARRRLAPKSVDDFFRWLPDSAGPVIALDIIT